LDLGAVGVPGLTGHLAHKARPAPVLWPRSGKNNLSASSGVRSAQAASRAHSGPSMERAKQKGEYRLALEPLASLALARRSASPRLQPPPAQAWRRGGPPADW